MAQVENRVEELYKEIELLRAEQREIDAEFAAGDITKEQADAYKSSKQNFIMHGYAELEKLRK